MTTQAGMFFKSPSHRNRLLQTTQQIGKINDGVLDCEYGAALYILTASAGVWNKASGYVSPVGIDIPAMLQEQDFSEGYSVLEHRSGSQAAFAGSKKRAMTCKLWTTAQRRRSNRFFRLPR